MSRKFFNWKVNLLLVILVLMILAINPNPFAEGFEVSFVRGEVAERGLKTGDIVKSVNGKSFDTLAGFYDIIDPFSGKNETVVIVTDKGEIAYLASEKPQIELKKIQTSNIELGLDLSGGTRILLRPDTEDAITGQQITDIIQILNNRLNTYGLGDLLIREASDGKGNSLILVELSGVSKEEVEELVAQQGVFEAKIGDETVFQGSEKDVTFVCRNDGTCSGIRQCQQISEQEYACTFEFAISLSAEAAQQHADITKDIPVNISVDSTQRYLAEPLDLYLDGQLVDSLQISEGLKGIATTAISISGSGFGIDEQSAYDEALNEMNRLQTVLITGSLPFKLKIEKLDNISSFIGEGFIRNALLVGILSFVAVALIMFLRYRKFRIILPVLFTLISEILITLGCVALFGQFFSWKLDLAGIAGLIATVGTGVNDQVLLLDEITGKHQRELSWKERFRRAWGIIFSANGTTTVAMLPLITAGAGLLRGFALTTIFGIAIGVFVTRPAFASVVGKLLEE